MKKISALALLVFLIYYIYSTTISAHERVIKKYEAEREQIIKAYRDTLNSERLHCLEVFQDCIKKLDRMEGDRNYWRRKNGK